MRGTWQTTSGGGGGGVDLVPILVIAAVILVGPAVLAAAVEIVHLVLFIAIALAVAAVASLGAVVVWRVRHPGARGVLEPVLVHRSVPPARTASVTPPAAPRAIEGPQLHLHFHGTPAEEAAAI